VTNNSENKNYMQSMRKCNIHPKGLRLFSVRKGRGMFFILFLGSAEKVPKFQEVFVICEG